MRAHVSASPNHQVHRITSLKARGDVVIAGQFGYELDIEKLSQDELDEIKDQIKLYKKIRKTVHNGNMYRLESPFGNNFCSWSFVSENQDEVVFFFASIHAKLLDCRQNVRLCGLDSSSKYKRTDTGEIFGGDFLMNVGLYFDNEVDYKTDLIVFERVY